MTAARLGQQVGVSESTTVRFAMQLGYAGYPEFQRALEEMVMNRLNSVQRMQFTLWPRAAGRNSGDRPAVGY